MLREQRSISTKYLMVDNYVQVHYTDMCKLYTCDLTFSLYYCIQDVLWLRFVLHFTVI